VKRRCTGAADRELTGMGRSAHDAPKRRIMDVGIYQRALYRVSSR
jgi:hypothetical protein